jgi:hypothetical protein
MVSQTQPLFIDDVALAPQIGLSTSFLRKDRRTARVIPFVRAGGRILYSLEQVRAALLARQVGGSQKVGQTRSASSA